MTTLPSIASPDLTDAAYRALLAGRIGAATDWAQCTLGGVEQASPDWLAWGARRIASEGTKAVRANVLYDLARHIGVHPACFLEINTVWRAWPADHPSLDDWQWTARRSVRAIRMKRKVGTVILAREAGYNQSGITRIESGQFKFLDLVVLRRIAVALHTTPHHLFYPEDGDGQLD